MCPGPDLQIGELIAEIDTIYSRFMAKDAMRVSDAVRQAEVPRGRLLSESIDLAETHAKEFGYEPTMDGDFAADLREIINSRKPRGVSAF